MKIMMFLREYYSPDTNDDDDDYADEVEKKKY